MKALKEMNQVGHSIDDLNVSYISYIWVPILTHTIIWLIWLDLLGFYGISTLVGYLMLNPFNTYILDIYDLVCLDLMAFQTL